MMQSKYEVRKKKSKSFCFDSLFLQLATLQSAPPLLSWKQGYCLFASFRGPAGEHLSDSRTKPKKNTGTLLRHCWVSPGLRIFLRSRNQNRPRRKKSGKEWWNLPKQFHRGWFLFVYSVSCSCLSSKTWRLVEKSRIVVFCFLGDVQCFIFKVMLSKVSPGFSESLFSLFMYFIC